MEEQWFSKPLDAGSTPVEGAKMKKLKKFILDRYWFGWWFASYCSAHQEYEPDCHTCQGGSWGRNTDDDRLFGKIIQNKK